MSDLSSTPQYAEDARNDVAAYAFGCADPAEADAVRRLLQGDTEAAADLAEFESLRELFLFAAPTSPPPAAVEARLLASLESEKTSIPVAAPPPVRPRPRFGGWFAPATRPAWALAVGAMLLLLLTNGLWFMQTSRLRQEQASIRATLAAQGELAVLMSDKAQETTLPAPESGEAQAHLYWEPDASVAVLLAETFPELAPGMVYQVWLIEGDQRISGGLFRVGEGGSGMTVVRSPKPLQQYDAVGITPEPAGGSPGPTAPPVVRGPLSL